MELKKRFSFRKCFTLIYALAFLAYIVVGLSPADAVDYQSASRLVIPAIELDSQVIPLALDKGELKAPDTIAGSFSRANNKTLLIGHSATVFKNLNDVELGDTIIYSDTEYTVTDVEYYRKEDINMNRLLRAGEKDTLVLMTCAGTLLENHDATERLIITAVSLAE